MLAAGIIYSSSPFWPMHILSTRVYTYTVLVNMSAGREGAASNTGQ